MSSGVTSCLLSAVEQIKKSKTLTSAEQQAIIDKLTDEIRSHKGTAEQQVAKALLSAKQATRDVFNETVARAKAEAHEAAYAERVAGQDLASAADELASAIVRKGGVLDRDIVTSARRNVEDAASANSGAWYSKLTPVFEMMYDFSVVKGAVYAETPDAAKIWAAVAGAPIEDLKIGAAAKLVTEVFEEVADRTRAAGVYVEKRRNFTPLTHSFDKIQMAREEWFAFMEQRLDPELFPDPRAYAELLYNNIGGRTALTKNEFRAGHQARTTEFRTAKDLVEYQARFGDGTPGETLRDYLTTAARDLALIEVLGPRPGVFVENAVALMATKAKNERNALQAAGKSTRAVDKAEEKVRFAEQAAAAYLEPVQNPLNAAGPAWLRAVTSWNAAWKLGKTVSYGLTLDPASLFHQTRLRTGGYFSAASEFVQSFGEAISKMRTQEGRALLEEYDIRTMSLSATATEGVLSGNFAGAVNSVTGQYTPGSSSVARAQKVQQAGSDATAWVMRVTAATAMQRHWQAMAALSSSRLMAKGSRRGWADLPPTYRKLLEGFGFNANVWTEVQKLPLGPNGALDPRGADPWLKQLLHSAMTRDAKNMTNVPGMRERMTLGMFTADTGFLNVVGKSAYQTFLAWPMAFMNNAVNQQVRIGGWGSVGFFGAIVAASVVNMQMRAAVSGRGMFDWTNPGLWGRAIIGSGMLGPMAESVIAAGMPHEGLRPLGGALALTGTPGPVIGNLIDVAQEAYEGEYDKALFSGMQAANSALPNLWFLDGVTNRVLQSAASQLDPEYSRRMERNAREKQVGLLEE